jgi:hypothetical protein
MIAAESAPSDAGSSATIFSLTEDTGPSKGTGSATAAAASLGIKYAASCAAAAKAAVSGCSNAAGVTLVLPFGGRISSLTALLALGDASRAAGFDLLLHAAASDGGAGSTEEENGFAAHVAAVLDANALLIGAPDRASTIATLDVLESIESSREERIASVWPIIDTAPPRTVLFDDSLSFNDANI